MILTVLLAVLCLVFILLAFTAAEEAEPFLFYIALAIVCFVAVAIRA